MSCRKCGGSGEIWSIKKIETGNLSNISPKEYLDSGHEMDAYDIIGAFECSLCGGYGKEAI